MELYEASRCFFIPDESPVEKLIVFNCFELGERRVAGISWQFLFITIPWYERFRLMTVRAICQHQKLLNIFIQFLFELGRSDELEDFKCWLFTVRMQ